MPKGVTIRLYRAEAAGNLPAPLEQGELAIDALSNPPRLWTGVPVSRDPSGRVNLLDTGAGGVVGDWWSPITPTQPGIAAGWATGSNFRIGTTAIPNHLLINTSAQTVSMGNLINFTLGNGNATFGNAIRVTGSATPPTVGVGTGGMFWYDQTASPGNMRYWNGQSWVSMASPFAAPTLTDQILQSSGTNAVWRSNLTVPGTTTLKGLVDIATGPAPATPYTPNINIVASPPAGQNSCNAMQIAANGNFSTNLTVANNSAGINTSTILYVTNNVQQQGQPAGILNYLALQITGSNSTITGLGGDMAILGTSAKGLILNTARTNATTQVYSHTGTTWGPSTTFHSNGITITPHNTGEWGELEQVLVDVPLPGIGGTIALRSRSINNYWAHESYYLSGDWPGGDAVAGHSLFGAVQMFNSGSSCGAPWGGLPGVGQGLGLQTNGISGIGFRAYRGRMHFYPFDQFALEVTRTIPGVQCGVYVPGELWGDSWMGCMEFWAQVVEAQEVWSHLWRPFGLPNPSYYLFAHPASGDLQWHTDLGEHMMWRRGDRWTYTYGTIGAAAWADLSDMRTKTAVEPERHGLDVVRALNPIDFERVERISDPNPLPPPRPRLRSNRQQPGNRPGAPFDDPPARATRAPLRRMEHPQIGFSAQEVQAVLPNAVATFGVELPDGSGGMDTATPSIGILPMGLIAVCVNAIKELEQRLIALEQKNGNGRRNRKTS